MGTGGAPSGNADGPESPDVNHVLVVPAIHRANTAACLGTLNPDYLSRVYLIDNTEDRSIIDEWEDKVGWWHAPMRNLGVAASWNSGLRAAFEAGATFATITSTSMRFHDGGKMLIDTADLAASQSQWPYGFESTAGWHLFTAGRRLTDEVGWFDEKFYPAYYEDNDYIWRCRVAGVLEPRGEYFRGHPHFEDFSVRQIPWVGALDYECVQNAHAYEHCRIEVDWSAHEARYVAKWGGMPGSEQWVEPFNGGEAP